MNLPQNPMQLLPHYKAQLSAKFLAWYLQTFKNPRRSYGHWSVTGRCVDNQEYHQSIEDDGTRAFTTTNCSPAEDMFAHTYHRNTNAWATCFESMAGGDTDDLGPNAPTPRQIVEFIRVLSNDHTNQHVPIGNFMSHGEAADNRDFPTRDNANAPHDPYGPSTTCERWDLEAWVDPKSLALLPFTKPCPAGWEHLPDYIRGQAILHIQEQTRDKWAA